MSVDCQQWLTGWSEALSTGDAAAVAALFHPDGMWRDLVAFGWTIATHEGDAELAQFARALDKAHLRELALEPLGNRGDEAFFSIDAPSGSVRGHLRLREGRAVTLLTALDQLRDHPEAVGARRPTGQQPGGVSWAARRGEEAAVIGNAVQPYVLIVGAGQSGLALAARLRALDVPALLIDKYPRVGDQWRSRYESLLLHDPVWYDHLPYMPFPQNWPVYTPKDKMGEWLELYARAMELQVWNSTTLQAAVHVPEQGHWRVRVEREGREIELRPTHLVMAVGNAGFPRVPEIPGAERFAGPQLHSSAHQGGEALAGKRVAIIGANNSAHDIAANLVEVGAFPTMIQRTSTLVVRQSTMFETMIAPVYSEAAVAAGFTTDRADLLSLAQPMRYAEQRHPAIWARIAEKDRDFYDRLRGAGFALDFAEDGAGMGLKYLRAASGYYIDVGASAMVIDGRIAVRSGVAIDHLDETGIVFADGSRLACDAIIYATGFGAMEEWASVLLGAEIAKKIGRCWGYGSGFKGDPGPWEGELRNMWKPTAQEGLWFMGGNLQQGRIYSRFLAQQLKARHAGIAIKVVKPQRDEGTAE